MTYELTIAEQLLTWLDVERVLKQVTCLWVKLPTGIHSVDCYHDGMDISHSVEAKSVIDWLSSVFGKAFSDLDISLNLRAGEGRYPIHLEKVTPEASKPLPLYPLWREVTYLQKSPKISLPQAFTDGPQLVSFHSFKGGVGRTTALMTYVTARLFDPRKAKTGVKVLVVDADLEAPGVTFWLDEQNRPQVSFIQFMEAMHYPPVSEEATLDFFANELKKTSMNVDGVQRELFVLPAALSLTEIQDMPIQPSHLARNSRNPWILTDHLHALGKRLGVDAVFIDLRAGLSELSSTLIFDHRVEHYFVTTVAKQSVIGMCEVLKRLHVFNSSLSDVAQRGAKPSVVVSLLTPDLRRLPDFSCAKERIESAYPPVGEGLDEGVEWLEVDFSSSFMAIGSIREAFDSLKQSSLYVSAQDWARTAVDMPNLNVQKIIQILDKKKSAEALLNVCKQEYAEHSSTDDWLVTEPLRNLGKHYSRDIPNAVIVGAKGAGKTFTYLQICNSKTWFGYLSRVGESVSGDGSVIDDRLIFPILWSSNLEGVSKLALDAAQKNGFKFLGISKEQQSLTSIQKLIKNNKHNWDDFWDELICLSFGGVADNLSELNRQLLEKKQSVVLIFDGIEDVFADPSQKDQQEAIESLLRLVNRMAELQNQRIGVLLFVRIDYVQAAIKQNLGQFLSRFNAFQLTWNPESFLRLAYWLCAKANIINASIGEAQTLEVSELIDRLTPLWGQKLGQTNSKEGHSARWVYAALCDLTGIFQARDLVRFFQIAAEREVKSKNDSWADRVLSPESMRRAIPDCSVKKVEEAKAEIAPLRSWFNRMAKKQITERQIPFSAASVLLEPEELRVLRELGVIYEDSDKALGDKRLFLPEIYRAGLKFDLSSGRPRIQALLKKNLGKMPF